MPSEVSDLGQTVKAMRPMVPAKNFAISKQFYADLGFRPQMLTDGLAEMHLGAYSFLLQNYYVPQWADNLVFHVRVSDLARWWDHIVALDLPSRYRVKVSAPHNEIWGMVVDIIDPSGVLWRIAESPASESF